MGKEIKKDQLVIQARIFRSNPTEAEKKLWKFIRDKQLNGIRFRRQHVINRFIVDFYCPQVKFVIEIDGKIHENQADYDQAREEWLRENGYSITRFKNEQVLFQTERVLDEIVKKYSDLTSNKDDS